MNLGISLATVARFVRSCRTNGWSITPAYHAHIHWACRAAGMSIDDASKFAQAWALDAGGPGPAGPLCCGCSNRLTDAEVDACEPGHDEYCAACAKGGAL